jgi:UDP-GlcNAc3NAcA epimerase
MKIVTIVGARPQFIKAAAVSRAIQALNQKKGDSQVNEIVLHTGQHYDDNMSRIFFDELEIRQPDYYLGVGSGTHGWMTAFMLSKIEKILLDEKPDSVMVYGDTNSTLAGALAAAKLHIPVAHVEAGLRSFNRKMPEEINRKLTDHVSSQLFCPTDIAVANLQNEGIIIGVFKVGDVMFDSFLFNKGLSEKKSNILSSLGLQINGYCLATIHREENTTDMKKLAGIFKAFDNLASPDHPFIIPLHPRTHMALNNHSKKLQLNPYVRLMEPVSYLDMVSLETNARIILTDSGGVQKEAFFAKKPCITLREETEWVELIEEGVNLLAGSDPSRICYAYEKMLNKSLSYSVNLFGDGYAGEKIVNILRGCTYNNPKY